MSNSKKGDIVGILNNAFNKKDKKMDTKAPLILSMPMFKGDSGYSLEKVIEDLNHIGDLWLIR